MHTLTATKTLSWNSACCFRYYCPIQTFTIIQTITGIEHCFSKVYCRTFWLVPLLLMLLNIQLMMIFHIKTLQEKSIKVINICRTTVQCTVMVCGFFISVCLWSCTISHLTVQCLSTNLQDSTCQRTVIWISNTVRMSKLWTSDSIHGMSFTSMWPCCILTNFFIIKPTRCTNFTNLFWHETLHVSDSSCVHHQEFIHFTLSNGICHTGL